MRRRAPRVLISLLALYRKKIAHDGVAHAGDRSLEVGC